MRLSSLQIFSQGLNGITNASSEVARTQQQISSGLRVVNPSDDPVASARILELETELSLNQQYRRNIDNVDGRLSLAETQLVSVESALNRIRVLVVQANNGTLDNSDRDGLALEIDQRLEELFDISNARDANGDSIFSGFKTSTQAFERIGDRFVYQGDEGIRFEQIGNGLTVASNLTGKDLFGGIETVNNSVLASASSINSSTVQISSASVSDQAIFDAVFPEDYVIRFNDLGNVAPPGPNYSITRVSDGQAVVSDVPFDPAVPINFNGVDIRFNGTPTPNDAFIIESTQNEDMLTIIQRVAENLARFTDPDERSAFMGNAITDIDSILETVVAGRAKIGATLNTVDSARSNQESLDQINQSFLSDLRDLDYAEAVSRLSFQSFVLEAAQQSFVQVANLSLFNFIR